jgi:phosphoadenosine phosphosulfate reductase
MTIEPQRQDFSTDAVPSLEALAAAYGHLRDKALLDVMVNDVFKDRIALVSSFGSESAVLLQMAAEVRPDIPVIFLNTGKLFGETLRYRRRLEKELGLTGIRDIRPDEAEVEAEDQSGLLWTRDPDACCALRKVRPLDKALQGFDAWITGRKRFQTATRAELPAIERTGKGFKINPLIDWAQPELQAYVRERNLPVHPLVADGYLSIGCMPCTRRVQAGESYRDGRWAGRDKTECGIHIAENI